MVKKREFTVLFITIVFIIIILDQILKFWVKMNMSIGEYIPLLGQWFNLYFVENEGMAFGISFGEKAGKLLLSLSRLIIVTFLIYYIFRQVKRGLANTTMVVIFSVIVAGALGNIIDSCFYGMIFSESTVNEPAVLFPPGGGYGGLFFGKVVDMFYLKLFFIPEWFPLWGGSYFFPAIFNLADACVTGGLVGMLIFNKHIFIEKKEKNETGIDTQADQLAGS